MAVWRAAKATIDTLRDLGMEETCFIGGLAARLYGNDREPHDADVLILDSQWDQEEIKRKMERKNLCFYRVPSKVIGATHQVLWYHPNGRGSTRRPAAIKIDILLPGIMELPSFNPSYIYYENDYRLPTAPLSLVLLHKVRGWSERISSSEMHHYVKHWKDARDVEFLAPLAARMGVTIDEKVLSEEFIDSSIEWVNKFIATYPELHTGNHWRKIYRISA